MKKYSNLTIVISLLLFMLTVVGFLTFGAIQTNEKNERLIADLNTNFELKVSQIQDKITGQKTIIVERTNNQDGKDGANGKNGINGKDGQNGKDGVNGLNGSNATSEQIAAAVIQYFAINPPKQGDPGNDGKDGIDGRDTEFCYQTDGQIGQRYVGQTVCRPIEKVEE